MHARDVTSCSTMFFLRNLQNRARKRNINTSNFAYLGLSLLTISTAVLKQRSLKRLQMLIAHLQE